MKSNPLKIGALSCALAFGLNVNTAQAAVASDLDSILSAVGSVHFTSPSSVRPDSLLDPLRPGVDLGRVRVRIPHFTLVPITFTAPSLNSSCSSFDLIGGNFTMLSLDEAVAILRNITSGTLTYALGQSIRALCPQCWSGMQEMQDWINEMNQMSMNSCKLSEDFGGKIAQGFKDARCNVLGGLGITTDKAECEDSEAKDEQEVVNNAAQAELSTGKAMLGNLVYEALDEFGSGTDIPLASEMLGVTVTDREFMMNLLGTKIIKPLESKTIVPVIYPELFASLVYGVEEIEGNTNKILKCSGSFTSDSGREYECVEPTYETNSGAITPLGLVVENLILNDTDSIYNRLVDANTTGNFDYSGMPPAQVKLMNYVDVNVASAMFFTPNPLASGARDMFKMISDAVRHDVGNQFFRALYNRVQEIPIEVSKEFEDEEINLDLKKMMSTLLVLSMQSARERDNALSKLYASPFYREALQKYNTSRELSEANN